MSYILESERPYSMNTMLFQLACESNDLSAMKANADAGADVSATICFVGQSPQSVLLVLSGAGNLEAVQWLLTKNAYQLDVPFDRAILIAIRNSHYKLAKWLIQDARTAAVVRPTVSLLDPGLPILCAATTNFEFFRWCLQTIDGAQLRKSQLATLVTAAAGRHAYATLEWMLYDAGLFSDNDVLPDLTAFLPTTSPDRDWFLNRSGFVHQLRLVNADLECLKPTLATATLELEHLFCRMLERQQQEQSAVGRIVSAIKATVCRRPPGHWDLALTRAFYRVLQNPAVQKLMLSGACQSFSDMQRLLTETTKTQQLSKKHAKL